MQEFLDGCYSQIFFFFFLKTEYHSKLALNLWQSFFLSFLNARITDMSHYTQVVKLYTAPMDPVQQHCPYSLTQKVTQALCPCPKPHMCWSLGPEQYIRLLEVVSVEEVLSTV